MISKVFSIYSKEMSVYAAPFTARDDAEACFYAAQVISGHFSEDSFVQLHPECFDLYLVGEFDHDSSALTNVQPVLVRSLKQIADTYIAQREIMEKGVEEDV